MKRSLVSCAPAVSLHSRLGWFDHDARAQSPATHHRGRVFDAGRASIWRKPGSRSRHHAGAFTDPRHYRFTGVPAGAARVKVFSPACSRRTRPSTSRPPDRRARHHAVGDRTKPHAADEAVKLAEFVVSTSKEMDGAAIAINEQRFARNIVTVRRRMNLARSWTARGRGVEISPGITMDYSAGEARTFR